MRAILCIIDGLGVCDESHLSVPFIQKHLDQAILLEASGVAVGLVERQMGNSEVGHMTIGSGRIIKQSLPKINDAIANNDFPLIYGESFHIVGLLSDGGVHSHINHILYLIKHLQGKKVYIHIITDGRDTSPKSAERYVAALQPLLSENCKIATISGRYYAMDRDNKVDRTEAAFRAIMFGKSDYEYNSEFIHYQYKQGITDEFFYPACSSEYKGITPSDTIIFANFRSDRMRQLVKRVHTAVMGRNIISMVDYFNGALNNITHLFHKEEINNTLGEIIAKAGKKQLRIAETEKYAHVTFFFNCGQEQNFVGEDRILVQSPKIKTYDLKPAMSAYEIMDKLSAAIKQREYDFICVNFANADMVGHTGNFAAAKQACDVINECLEILSNNAIENEYTLFITADHGNIEQMFNLESNQPHTAHTLNKVPFICINNYTLCKIPHYSFGLQDVAPTILRSMNIPIPIEMTGKNLLAL